MISCSYLLCKSLEGKSARASNYYRSMNTTFNNRYPGNSEQWIRDSSNNVKPRGKTWRVYNLYTGNNILAEATQWQQLKEPGEKKTNHKRGF